METNISKKGTRGKFEASARKVRNILKIKPSKYEYSTIRAVRKVHWNHKFEKIQRDNVYPPAHVQSAKYASVLPTKLYEDVCDILNDPIIETSFVKELESGGYDAEYKFRTRKKTSVKTPHITDRRFLTISRELSSDTDVEVSPRTKKAVNNEHYSFLRKGLRQQVTWPSKFLPPEKEDEKDLLTRANDLTDRIAKEFCDYVEQLGGNQHSHLFTTETIKELFKIEFNTHAAKGLKVEMREMPCIPDSVAAATMKSKNSRKTLLNKKILDDLRAGRKARRVCAFGRSLPPLEQWHGLSRNTVSTWNSKEHVPKELVSLEAVWSDIVDLRSVKDYCRWLLYHPELPRPPFLQHIHMFNLNKLNARFTLESNQLELDDEVPIDDLKKRLSTLTTA